MAKKSFAFLWKERRELKKKMEFKLTIGEQVSKRTYKAELKSPDADKLVGKKIGDKFKGELLSLAGYELEITGGSDNAGFPMRRDMQGPARRRAILTSGVGFHSHRKGLRRRKSVRGNTISTDTAQVNCKVIKAGSKKLGDVLGTPREKAEAPVEKPVEKKEEPKKEEKKEEKPKDTSEQVPRASSKAEGKPKKEEVKPEKKEIKEA